MRPILLRLLTLALLMTGALGAQIAPTVGIVEFYGLKKVPVARVRKALGVAVGDKLPGNKPQIEDRIAEVPGIVLASISAACCTDGKAILYVGVEEKGARHFDVRTPPEEDVVLPGMITESYRKFIATVVDGGASAPS